MEDLTVPNRQDYEMNRVGLRSFSFRERHTQAHLLQRGRTFKIH